jgi:hypothetical protein
MEYAPAQPEIRMTLQLVFQHHQVQALFKVQLVELIDKKPSHQLK